MANSIYITGDIANDYFLIRGRRFYSDDQTEGTTYIHHRGGAWLIYEFLDEIRKVKESLRDKEFPDVQFGYEEDIFAELPEKNNSFASVSPFHIAKNQHAWRIDEFFGFGSYSDAIQDVSDKVIPSDDKTSIYIVDDAGVEFGSEQNADTWHALIKTIETSNRTSKETLVICKKSGDIHHGRLFNELLESSGEQRMQLLTIISVNDIRRQEARISSGLSWEQSAIDLVYELKTNPALNYLNKSSYLVVTFQSSGALFVVNQGNGLSEYKLIFDPCSIEGDDDGKNDGWIIGRMSLFTAAFASSLDLKKKDKYYLVENAIKAGLTAIRIFYKTGYKPYETGVFFPYREVALGLIKNEFSFSSAFVPSPGENPAFLDTAVNGK